MTKMRILQKFLSIALLINAFSFGVLIANAQTQPISVSVSKTKIERGETIEILIKTNNREKLSALLLKPAIGTENLDLQKTKEGVFRVRVEIKKDAAAGLYAVHAWTGDKANPKSVGKAFFRVGNIVADFFITNYLDKQNPSKDFDNYLQNFKSISGNFLIAHNLIISSGAFYPSKIAKTQVKRGSKDDLLELVLSRANKEGFSVLLSVGA